MDIKDRTTEALREAAQLLLTPGKRVRIEYRITNQSGERERRKTRKGTILALYPYIFSVQIGNKIESFRYNELFGNEEVKIRV